MKSAVFTFGRFNPPTIGHEKLIMACEREARKTGADVHIFASHKEDKKKDPLPWRDKVEFMKKAFPKYRRTINDDGKIINALQAASYLYGKGYRELTMVVGGDRILDFSLLLNKYNGERKTHGYYDFDKSEYMEITTDIPDCEYWNFQLENYWMESLDYRHYPIHINESSATFNNDGTLTINISHLPMNIKNNLITEGRNNGAMLLRWIGASSYPIPNVEIKKINSLEAG